MIIYILLLMLGIETQASTPYFIVLSIGMIFEAFAIYDDYIMKKYQKNNDTENKNN